MSSAWYLRRILVDAGLITARLSSTSSSSATTSGSYLHGVGGSPLEYVTAGQALAASAERWPGRVAVRSPFENKEYTYEQLITQADALARSLAARGVERGDRLGIWSHNSAGWVLALVACLREGIIPVAINPQYEKPELEFCLRKTGTKALLLGSGVDHRVFAELEPTLPDLTTVIVAGNETLP